VTGYSILFSIKKQYAEILLWCPLYSLLSVLTSKLNNLRYKKTIYFGQLTKNKGGKMSFLNKFPKTKFVRNVTIFIAVFTGM